MAGLTQQDFAQLQQYASTGDRYSYWNYLAKAGDSYAKMALGVVTSASDAGYVANHYAASFAPDSSALANPNNTQAWWPVGVDLMKADLAARQQATNPLDLPFRAIEKYHVDVFAQHGLPREAWTPFIPFKGLIESGNWIQADQSWHQMLAGAQVIGAYRASLTELLSSSTASSSDKATWLGRTHSYEIDFNVSATIIGRDRAALNNANYIEGWSYNPGTGEWTQAIGSPLVGLAGFRVADPATAQRLNEQRQFRLDNFGGNVLKISSLGDSISLSDPSSAAQVLLTQAGAFVATAAANDPISLAQAVQYNTQLQNQFAGLLQGHDLSNAVQYVDGQGIRHYVFADGYEIRLQNGKFATTSEQVLADGTTQWTQKNFDDTQNIVSISPPAADGSVTTTFQTAGSDGIVNQTTKAVSDASGNPLQITQTDAYGHSEVVFSSTTSSGAQALFQSLGTVGDALSLIKAIQTGNPLPVVVSGLRVANDLSNLNNLPNTNLAGAASVGGSILSLMSLDNALKRGDGIAAVTAGAQAITMGASAYASFLNYQNTPAASALQQAINQGEFGNAGSAIEGLNNAIPYLNLVNSIAHGDALGTAAAVADLALVAMKMTPVVGEVVMVFELVSSLFGGDSSSVPDPWGSGRYVWNGTGIGVSAAGQTGGDQAVSSFLNNVLASMNTLIAREQAVNPGSSLGIIPNRMPELGYGMDGFRFTDIDPLTGVQKNPSLRYDTSGRPYNAAPGSPESYRSLGESFLLSGIARGAIAPQWEVQTAARQTQLGDPQAGLTEEERAGRAGDLAAAPAGPTQTWRPVVLDLGGDGIQTVAKAQSGVAFDVDDSGYLKNTAWIRGDDAFLTLDRNYNGSIDSGKELFSNGQIGLDRRGLAGLAWIDADHDGTIDANDPVYNQLKLWQDRDGNGIAEANEQTTLAQDGITALNYTLGTFAQNGAVKQMASPDLQADTQGARVNVIPEGILVQNSNGQTSLLVTRVDDLTQTQANADHVTGIENVELIVSGADLLANDTFGGFSGRTLTLTGVQNAQHGSAYLDANGMVHFRPQTYWWGEGARFDYTVAGPNGQLGTATVQVSLEHVEQPPTLGGVEHTTRPIYGYEVSTDDSTHVYSSPPTTQSQGVLIGAAESVPLYAPYYTSPGDNTLVDPSTIPYFSWVAPSYQYHNTPVAYEDTGGGRVDGTDPDDPASALTYTLVNQPQYGTVSLNADGSFQYTSWKEPNTPSDRVLWNGQYAGYKDGALYYPGNLPSQAVNPTTDVFQVKITDPAGLSTTQSISVPHFGPYLPPVPQGGGGGGKKPIAIDLDQQGFSFTKVDDSNVFFDVNGDGWKHRMAWLKPNEGLLAYDPNGTGTVTDASQIALAAYKPNAQTDLEGLVAFDTDHDGVFDKNDAAWRKFGVWRDADGNGVCEPGEFKTLDQLGIASVSLASDGRFSVVDGVTVHGIAQVTMTDGTTRNAADVTLPYSRDVQVHRPDGSTAVVTPAPFAAPGEIDGTDGNDLILGTNGNLVIKTGEGNDVVFSGDGNDIIQAGNGNDVIYAGNGNDLITAGNGNNVIYTGRGNDVVIAGNGNNAIFAQGGNDVIFVGNGNNLISGGAGNDVIRAGNGDNTIYAGNGNTAVFAGNGNNTIVGGAGTNRIQVGNGNNTLIAGSGPATLIGGSGNNTFVINSLADDVQAQAGGVNTVMASISYVAPAHVQNLTLTGNADLTATGNELDNVLTGNAGHSTLIAGTGNDTLVAGAGATTLIGGSGNTTFVVNKAADVVQAKAGAVNTIRTSVSYTTAANVQNLVGIGNADITLTGNDLADTIVANDGNDTLVAGSGVATMIGGTGNDTFVVNNGADTVIEQPNAGIDTVLSSVNYVMPANVEILQLTGTGNLTATGNDQDNILIGNAGQSTLVAGNGNATLIAGSGIATMIGGTGSDTFVVNNAADVVQAKAGAINTIKTSVSYTAAANVQNLIGTGNADLTLTGNDLANVIAANDGNDTLIAGFGIATMIGGKGNDTFVVNNAADVVQAKAGAVNTIKTSVSYTASANVQNLIGLGTADITLTGNDLANTIIANDGNDTLVAGSGIATMTGGKGNDTFVVNNVADVVQAQAGGINTIKTSVSYTASANVKNLVGIGSDGITLTGNDLADTIVANDAGDTLIAGSGVATMIGGAGNDTFVVNNVADVVIEQPNAGIDTILTSVSYVLPANVENLTGTGTADLTLTGNDLTNVITANSGNDTLIAGSGVATMIGGAGNDTFVVNNVADVVQAQAGGINTIKTWVSYTAPANVQNLIGLGSADLTLTGNDLADTIVANSGNDTLIAGSGVATMIGGAGNDTFVVNNTADIVQAQAGGINTIKTWVSYQASANVQNLIGLGSANLTLTGNGLDDTIVANSGNDTMIGGSGNVTFVAGAGNDTMIGGAGNDTYAYNLGCGLDTITDAGGRNTAKFGAGLTLQNVVARLTTADGKPYLVYADQERHGEGWGEWWHARDEENRGCRGPLNLTAHLRVVDANGVEQVGQGMDFAVSVDRYGNFTSPIQSFKFADGSGHTFDDMLVKEDVIDGRRMSGPIVTGRNDDTVYAGRRTTSVTLGSGNDTVFASGSGTLVYGGGGTDTLIGRGGNDTFIGGHGLAIMESGGGNDTMTAVLGQAAMYGGEGQTTMTGGAANDFFAGGSGSATINTGATRSVVAFNGGGRETILASPGAANTLSLGGGIDDRRLSFGKAGNDLVLDTRPRDDGDERGDDGRCGRIVFKDWYASPANRDFVTLQVIEEASGSYDKRSSDPLRNKKIEAFDFGKLVDRFDAARNANPKLNGWNLMNGLLDAHLSGSDTAAIGGDLAYQFGMRNEWPGMNASAIRATMTDPQFGKSAQTLHRTDGFGGRHDGWH